MSRSYRKITPNILKVYSVTDVQTLYGVCRNTASNWVRAGLRPSDSSTPQVFRGAELKRFHEERAARSNKQLRFGEFKCLGCGNAVFPEIDTVSIVSRRDGIPLAAATCCDCGARVMKLLNETECDRIKNCLDTNTELTLADERKAASKACIGKNDGSQDDEWATSNDRIILDWQAYAGRYSEKTMRSHLTSIRDFEAFSGGVCFSKITKKQVGEYRDHLVRMLALPKLQGGLSTSTVQHRASHLRTFLEWLRGQDGYRRLSSSLPDYLALPRSATVRRTDEKAKDYPTLDEAWRMVARMPTRTILERRDRAMVAFAFISGFRAATLTALRIRHVDFENRTVVQDAREVPAKNSKSYLAKWFPRTDAFQDVFLAWVEELKSLGFGETDALFPAANDLGTRSPDAPSIDPLNSSKPLQCAFKEASEAIGKRYTPHAARHSLKALGTLICRTHRHRKAWSLNLGHSDEQITERHYGKMSRALSCEIMDTLSSDEMFTEVENEIIIDYYEDRFARGTPEYGMARRLAERRERARGGCDVLE
ncbi:tyrosine-type recombinase/integrase [Litorisediminicola beolgyonensis]|uniref:Tyrosine-type recombinase/integrase n=1 Tax=Litorisediminicola beolgyonensis TaxID=1173614 RepID=A0ABW3ZE66_9RHOB